MGKYIDKEVVKDTVSIAVTVDRLGIKLIPAGKQFRGKCPLCNGDDERSFVITPEKNLWYSFCCETGGDQIKLWELLRGLNFKDACAEMLGEEMIASRTVEATEELTPLEYLLHDDPAVQCVGFEPEDAKAIGIGYAKKGTMKGTVAVPLRLEDGKLVGYIGVTEAVLPKSFRL